MQLSTVASASAAASTTAASLMTSGAASTPASLVAGAPTPAPAPGSEQLAAKTPGTRSVVNMRRIISRPPGGGRPEGQDVKYDRPWMRRRYAFGVIAVAVLGVFACRQ